MDDSFEFDNLISFSKKLLENKNILSKDNYQCVYRTILNKVYYSAFHHAKYWLEINYNFQTGKFQNKDGLSEHVQVFKELRVVSKNQKELKSKFRNASSKLECLFDKRIDADYHEYSKFNEVELMMPSTMLFI